MSLNIFVRILYILSIFIACSSCSRDIDLEVVKVENDPMFTETGSSWPEFPPHLLEGINLCIAAYDDRVLGVEIDSKRSFFDWGYNPTSGFHKYVYFESPNDVLDLTVYSTERKALTLAIDLRNWKYIHCFYDKDGNMVIGQSSKDMLYRLKGANPVNGEWYN